MTVCVWVGQNGVGGDDWNDPANWSPSKPSGTSDSVNLNHLAVRRPMQNLSALNGNYGPFIMTSGYRHGLGGAGASVVINCSATGAISEIAHSGGDVYLALTTPQLIAEGLGNGMLHLTGGTIALADLIRLQLELLGVITAARQQDGRAIIGSAGTAPTTWTQRGGDLFTGRSIGTLDVGYGEKGRARVITEGAAAITTLATIRSGAGMNHRAAANVANIVVEPGAILTRENAEGDASFTDMTLWKNSRLRMDVPGVVTNYNGSGGTNAATVYGKGVGFNSYSGGVAGFAES